MTALKIRGPFRGVSGHDHHVREFVRGLSALGAQIELVDLPEWSDIKLPTSMRDPWFESLRSPVDARVFIQFCMPHQAVVDPEMLNVNYTMFEADRIHPLWAERAQLHDLVVVPAESCRRAWIASGVPPDRVEVCPLGVDSARFGAHDITPAPLTDWEDQPLARFALRFLNIGERTQRKNLTGLVRCWLRATSPDDDAVLVIKIGSEGVGWERAAQELVAAQHDVGKTLSEAAPLHIIDELLPDEELPRLFAAATHYISLSYGEGWDLPMMEAAASGLELIAPAHSAYLTYLDEDVAHLLPSQPVPVVEHNQWTGPFFVGSYWWKPDEDATVTLLQDLIAGRAPTKRTPRDRILADFTWEAASRRLLELVRHLEKARVQRRWPGLGRYARSRTARGR
jgi:glycosyltransferase involved in cell wall biosynthesis